MNLVKVEYDQHLAIVYLNRKQKLNALNGSFIDEIIDTLKALNQNELVKGIVLTGTDRSFIVGADINEMKDLDSFSAVKFISKLQELLGLIRHLDKPVIASVNGYCYGAGLELAVSCDMLIASRQATFGMQEVQLGIPSVIEAAILPFVIGLPKTRELLLTGDVIDADEAKAIGLLNHVVQHDELLQISKRYAQKICKNAPHAISLQKRLINRWMENAGLEQSVHAGKEFFGLSFANEETRKLLASALKSSNKN
jgi:enoyl-CoA hydratase